MNDRVEIAEYDPQWPLTFDEIAGELVTALGPLALRIEHVGSTAVPGLAAKPIIDIDVVIESWNHLPRVTDALRPLGYQHAGNQGIAQREAFTTPPDRRAHHLYVCATDSRELDRHLTFRNTLRNHPDTARTYAQLKKDNARRFGTDRVAYTEAKSAFVEDVLTRSGRTNPS
ncbi:GrpB family protein [Nocardia sp. NPDC088792]|uniref:GrpB family protein n=1 Tax=Nocardia sp. NPDC088792 TaxID=3364332 RepID=UPI003817D040